MYSLEFLITATLATLIIGLVVGYIFAQRAESSPQAKRQLESQLADMQQQAEHYQHEVTEHFNETAELLNQLTDSYRDVHNHLAKGAQILATDSDAQQTLKVIEADNDAEEPELNEHTITPPLDYAPKTKPNEPGMLNEEFGLNKTPSSDDDTPINNGNK